MWRRRKRRAAEIGARRVALTALATGYGKLTMRQFGEGIRTLVGREFGAVEEVVVCVTQEVGKEELAGAMFASGGGARG